MTETQARVRGKSVEVDAVVAMFAIGTNFCCTKAKEKDCWLSAASWAQCGQNYAMMIKCPFNERPLNVTIRFCCGHFLCCTMHPHDAQNAALLVTNPSVKEDHAYEPMDPLRRPGQALRIARDRQDSNSHPDHACHLVYDANGIVTL
jgi:hypothetical protein